MRKYKLKSTTYTSYKPGRYNIYDELTGFKIPLSEAVKLPKYTGFDGFLTHKSNVFQISHSLVPFTPPSEKPGPMLPKENHTNITNAVEPLDYTVDVISYNNAADI